MTQSQSGYLDETRAVARLPNLDIEILHRVTSDGKEEQMGIFIRTTPSFGSFARMTDGGNPFLFWTRMMHAAWQPWLNLLDGAGSPPRMGRHY